MNLYLYLDVITSHIALKFLAFLGGIYMDSDKLMRGIIPGIIAGYLFLAFIGASVVPGDLSVTTDDAGMVTGR